MSDVNQQDSPQQRPAKVETITAEVYADIKGFDDLHRFAIKKMFSNILYPFEKWEEIAKEKKLL